MAAVNFLDICENQTRLGHKIYVPDYLPAGKYPIIDQSKKFIVAYSNDENGIYSNTPFIIFGDVTRVFKYVDFPCFLGADGAVIIKVINPNFVTKYVYYALLNSYIPDTGFNRHYKFLKDISIKQYSLEEQNNIIYVLDKINEAIQLENNRLLLLDELVKSRFLEMFGDPNINDKKWIKGVINDIGKCVAGATPSTAINEYWENGTIPWMSSGEVNKGRIFNTDTKISELGYKSTSTKLVPVHTVVLAMAGQGKTRGTAAITEIELCTNQSICSIVANNKVNPEYLLFFLKMQYEELRNSSNGAEGRGGLNLKIIGNFPIMIPPIELQNEFAAFVTSINNSKNIIKDQIKHLEELLNKKIDEYFGN